MTALAKGVRAVQISPRWQVLRGHAHGLRGPVLRGFLRWPASIAWNRDTLGALLRGAGGLRAVTADECLQMEPGLDTFLAMLRQIELAAVAPVTQVGVVLSQADVPGGVIQYELAVPAFRSKFTHAALDWLATAVNLAAGAQGPASTEDAERKAAQLLEDARTAMRVDIDAGGVNTSRIARASGELGLTAQWLPGGLLRVGSGAYSRLFMSTLTEATPALGSAVARSKMLTVSVLALQGLPVPRHRLVRSADEAVQAAQAFGYPVVVKPDDREGGHGVFAGLRDDAQVRHCYEQARAVSRRILVETHIEGEDFRITVDNGKVVKAIGRKPGGVTGDGASTVEALVAQAAAAAPRSRMRTSIVQLDDEALEMLAEHGMGAHSVPAAGEFIALRRRANMSTGGTSRNAIDAMHPDNARLAVRAAQALCLDVAGIDLIIPDISVSWLHCKAGICEVNAQPQISTEFAPEVFRDLLRRMVPAPGHMRAVLVLHATPGLDADAGVAEAAARLARRGERVLAVRSDGIWLGDERVAPAGRDAYAAAVRAEHEREATAVAAALACGELLQKGLPWLFLKDVHVVQGPGEVDVRALRECLLLIAPHVSGTLVIEGATARLVGDDVLVRFAARAEGDNTAA